MPNSWRIGGPAGARAFPRRRQAHRDAKSDVLPGREPWQRKGLENEVTGIKRDGALKADSKIGSLVTIDVDLDGRIPAR